ncbi:LysE family translocator [Testudinibacter sp. TR-2022]|uniref:LysE family translocator n=1 Tax=Testudinibacter sp. TR-2022 TaxID=2585029 RepID=UPI00111A598C|nr:LysE family transporter [Testudinibacter sp. TR-2022]TNH09182.1 LysE family translocator [Pasteurellaceae bacterium Phil11]TNH23562.1 LysE family translocator [Testudinibacter sp. TR-2022]TNH23741.1 LysE family translocator [Testudinibacter sp. TR-2022]
MTELLAIATITILAVISPGGDFAMTTRNSYLYGKRAGILTAVGIAAAVWVHVGYTLLGVSALLSQSPVLFNLVKTFGAMYLIYIGIATFRHRPVAFELNGESAVLSDKQAFKNGFVTNALNPKTTLFVLSTFTQIVNPDTPILIQIGYGAFMSLAHLLWFAAVAMMLSAPQIRQRLLQQQRIVNRIIGLILCGLGLMLLISSVSS